MGTIPPPFEIAAAYHLARHRSVRRAGPLHGVLRVFLVAGAGVTLALVLVLSLLDVEGAGSPDAVEGAYFQGPFLLHLLLVLLWFLAAIRPAPDRAREIRFLLSLPAAPDGLFTRFLIDEGARTFWVPTAMAGVMLVLAPLLGPTGLARTILALTTGYVLATSLGTMLGLQLASARADFLARKHPLAPALSVGGFALTLLPFLTVIPHAPAGAIWSAILLALAVAAAATLLARRRFRSLLSRSFWHQNAAPEGSRTATAASRATAKLFVANPWLAKNLLLALRARTGAAGVLTGVFLGLAAVAAGNNRVEDRADVLFWIGVIYAALFCYVFLDRITEPAHILHTLPARLQDLFPAWLLPGAGIPVALLAAIALLARASGVPTGDVVDLWLRSSYLGILFLILAVNAFLIRYPRLLEAKKILAGGILALTVGTVLLPGDGYLLAVLLAAISFLPWRRTTLFRTWDGGEPTE